MFANIFTTVIVQPIFNLLVLIYALLPGHNFGLAIIIFTIIIRLLLYPLVKKQLTHAKAMRELAPEIKKIKAATKGNRQEESRLTMELYKEREINPFASLGIILVQVPILIGLYSGLNRIIHDPHQVVSFAYSGVQHLSWIQTLSHNIHKFDDSLLGVVNLTRTAVGQHGVYWAGIVIVALAAAAQYFQSRQLMPKSQDARGLRAILREAGQGKQTDQAEVNAAVGRGTMYLVPGLVFIFAINLALALPLYWLTSSVVAIIQQAWILREDASEADAVAGKPRKTIKAGVTVRRKTINDDTEAKPKTSPAKPTPAKKTSKNRKNRRKRK